MGDMGGDNKATSGSPEAPLVLSKACAAVVAAGALGLRLIRMYMWVHASEGPQGRSDFQGPHIFRECPNWCPDSQDGSTRSPGLCPSPPPQTEFGPVGGCVQRSPEVSLVGALRSQTLGAWDWGGQGVWWSAALASHAFPGRLFRRHLLSLGTCRYF